MPAETLYSTATITATASTTATQSVSHSLRSAAGTALTPDVVYPEFSNGAGGLVGYAQPVGKSTAGANIMYANPSASDRVITVNMWKWHSIQKE